MIVVATVKGAVGLPAASGATSPSGTVNFLAQDAQGHLPSAVSTMSEPEEVEMVQAKR